MLTDTVGFFDYCIPLTRENTLHVSDSLQKYYDLSVYNYITQPPVPKEFLQTTSIFSNHQLLSSHKGPLPINRQAADWVTLGFVACLVIFAWLQTSYSKRLNQILRAAVQSHSVNQLERDGNLFSERITLGLGFIYYLVSSVFIFQLVREFLIIPPGFSNLAVTGIILISLFLYQLVKSAIIYTSGIIFNTRESARAYQLNILIFNHITGIVLFPVTIIVVYWNSRDFLITGIIIISLLLIYMFFRGVLTGLANKNYNLFYLFLYLCTLEILPLLLIYKVISKI